MKVKFGDLTLRQMLKACDATRNCIHCPIRRSQLCTIVNDIHCALDFIRLDNEIELPDEEVKDNAAVH